MATDQQKYTPEQTQTFADSVVELIDEEIRLEVASGDNHPWDIGYRRGLIRARSFIREAQDKLAQELKKQTTPEANGN